MQSSNLQNKLVTIPIPEEIQSELKSMPMDKLQKLADDVLEILKEKNVPRSLEPIFAAIIKELTHRNELLMQEAAELQQQIADKERECTG